jgi:hypothetical protein
MGDPVSEAKLRIVSTIPVRTPIRFRSVVKDVSEAGNRDCKLAEVIP